MLARSLESGLATIIDLPYWQDCLHFSNNGQLAEMRRVVPLAESDLLAKSPQIVSQRNILRKLLGISPIPDPIQELHSSISELSPLYPLPADADGSEFNTLFGKFTVMQNAVWRRRLTSQ